MPKPPYEGKACNQSNAALVSPFYWCSRLLYPETLTKYTPSDGVTCICELCEKFIIRFNVP